MVSNFRPRGDQPQAIETISHNIRNDVKHQTLLGVTGSGKTYTIASVLQEVQCPIIVISHNKTLAAQLYSEFKNFFPKNAVEYFVSYYDYYQPEAYLPTTDTYIDKDTSINDEIEKLRLSATTSLMSRRDVIVVASVSCIYGLGSPESIQRRILKLNVGQQISNDKIVKHLLQLQYERNDFNFTQGMVRVKGDVIDIFPAYGDTVIRLEIFGEEIENISRIDPLNSTVIQKYESIVIYPAKHFIIDHDELENLTKLIEKELKERVDFFLSEGKQLEAHRLETRVNYDLEMLRETGYCSGIENYSRYLSGRDEGEPPYTLLDYFPKNSKVVIDESHMTIPQLVAMHSADRSRKESLVKYGFRLPSALDNRPLTFNEFESKINQVIYISATPASYELEKSKDYVVEQIIRPTGLLDPKILVRPVKGQVDDIISEIGLVTERNERVLITTLTKRMAEDLTDYLVEAGVKSRYLHSEVNTLERVDIIRDLRKGVFDVLVGVNLLREGLDLPEVSLIGILDADKVGFLRNERALVQTIGRAARNANGRVIMYADTMTKDMKSAINETDRRRIKQEQHNLEHNIVPTSITKEVRDLIEKLDVVSNKEKKSSLHIEEEIDKDVEQNVIDKLENEMNSAAEKWEFERAAMIRDEIYRLKHMEEMKGKGISNIRTSGN
ncbi:MAG TPA: excinuclease ABC subunit UvrB [Nitrososphaerales archaeon]|nr:excinuclease ABC subunit UvrB [Nitrososphaerales archaeon]